MININFNNLMCDYKVVFFLALSEKVISVFSQKKDQEIAKDALDSCWRWLQYKENCGNELYDLLDDEYKGITIIQEMSEIDSEKVAWNCIIDAVAYTSRKAYEKEGVKYFPEPIELVDDSLINHFISCFAKCVKDSECYIRIIESFLNKYKWDGDSDLKSEILKHI